MRTRSGSFPRGFSAWLGAAYRPPAGRILGQFAHLAAASGDFRLRAAAIAAARGDFANAAGGVRPDGESSNADEESYVKKQPGGKAEKAFGKGRSHEELSFSLKQKKTDSSES